MKKQEIPNAYRVELTERIAFYKNNPSLIEDIYGKNFIGSNGNQCNNCNYDPNKKYLHFFSNLNDAKEYLLAHKNNSIYSILKFHFDPELLRLFTFNGSYKNPLDGKTSTKKEYILPLPEAYNAKMNFLGVVGKNELSKIKVDYDPDYYGGGFFKF